VSLSHNQIVAMATARCCWEIAQSPIGKQSTPQHQNGKRVIRKHYLRPHGPKKNRVPELLAPHEKAVEGARRTGKPPPPVRDAQLRSERGSEDVQSIFSPGST
jgi:hypothetical protein